METLSNGEKVVTKKELTNLLDINYETMYIYLQNFQFLKFRRFNQERKSNFYISLNDEFVKKFHLFLLRKKRKDAAKRLKKLYGEHLNLPTYQEFLKRQYSLIDCGFFNSEGEYIEDLQQVDKREINYGN